jgi:hypothetical protein
MGHSLKLPSPTKFHRLGHFPPASQAGRLAGLVFYVYAMVGEVPTVQSSGTNTDLPIVLADLFANFRSYTIASSLQSGRFLKQYNRFINCNLFLVREVRCFIAV